MKCDTEGRLGPPGQHSKGQSTDIQVDTESGRTGRDVLRVSLNMIFFPKKWEILTGTEMSEALVLAEAASASPHMLWDAGLPAE